MPFNEDEHVVIRFWGIDNGTLPDDINTKYMSLETSFPPHLIYCLPQINDVVGNDAKFFGEKSKNIDIQPGAFQEIKYFIFYSLNANNLIKAFNEIDNIPKFRGWVRQEDRLIDKGSIRSCAELVWYLLEKADIGNLSKSSPISSSSVDTLQDLYHDLFKAKNVELCKHKETQNFLGNEGQMPQNRCTIQ